MPIRPALDAVDSLTLNLVRRVCIGDLPTRGAQHFPDRVAIVDGKTELTYTDLEVRSNSAARGLTAAGLNRGGVVAMLVPNSWQFLVTFFGCAKAGLLAMPLNLGLSAEDLAFQLDDAGPEVVVADAAFLPLLNAALAKTTRTDVREVFVIGADANAAPAAKTASFEALLRHDSKPFEVIVDDRDNLTCLYTSGTTNLPKAVLTCHTAIMLACFSCALQMRHERGDNRSVFPIVLPLFHVTALDSLTLPVLLTGGTVVLHRGFDADALLHTLATYPVTHLMLIPSMWGLFTPRIDADTPGTANVKMCIYAMAPMSEQRLADVHTAFPKADVILGSGQTEFTPPNVLQWPSYQLTKNASWGSAVATTDVRIMGPDGTLLPRGQEGEIVYRGPQSMSGYGNNEKANIDAFAHGWFHSGDVGYIDDEGVVWFTDRIKDIVKSGGENVSSVEVERCILGHESVLECGIIGVPDDRWGESVTAIVVARPGKTVDEESVREHVKQHLAGYKVPKRVFVLTEIPKTSTGKVQKHLLRDIIAKKTTA